MNFAQNMLFLKWGVSLVKAYHILIWGIGNSILCEEINFGCEEWSRFESEIRDKSITVVIPFDDYYAQIRK